MMERQRKKVNEQERHENKNQNVGRREWWTITLRGVKEEGTKKYKKKDIEEKKIHKRGRRKEKER